MSDLWATCWDTQHIALIILKLYQLSHTVEKWLQKCSADCIFTPFLLYSHEEDQGVPDEEEEEEEEDCGILDRKKPDARSALQLMGYTLAAEEPQEDGGYLQLFFLNFGIP